MSILPFCLAALAGGALVVGLRARPAAAWLVGLAALLLAIGAGLSIAPGSIVRIGGMPLVATPYARLLVIVLSIDGLLLGLTAAATGGGAIVAAGALAALLGVGFALATPDPTAGIWAVLGGSVAALAVGLLGDRGSARLAAVTASLKAVALAAAVATIGVAIVAPLSGTSPDSAIVGLAYLGVALAVALRFAAIPLHAWASRLGDAIPLPLVAVVLAWLPAALASVALDWLAGPVASIAPGVGIERALVLALALATIGLGAVAAWIQDDVAHATAYLTIADAGVALLALVILDPAGLASARFWLLGLAVSKTALVAWAVAAEGTFGTRWLPDLSGWARRSPALGIAFALVALATVGWPGSPLLDARLELVDRSVEGPLAWLVRLGLLAVLASYGRIAIVGLGPLGAAAAGGLRSRPERPPSWALSTATGARDRLTAARADGRAVWDLNQGAVTAGATLVAAILATAIAAGALGGPSAAAGEGPGASPSASAGPSAPASPSEPASPSASAGPTTTASPGGSPAAGASP